MLLHVGLLGEGHGADGATERPLAGVDPEMAFEVKLFAENFIWKRAQKTTCNYKIIEVISPNQSLGVI